MNNKLFNLFKTRRKSRRKIECCAHVNPPLARFCGGCGLPLHVSTKPPDLTAHTTRRSGAKNGKVLSIIDNSWIVALPLATFAMTVILTFGSLLLSTQKISAANGFRDIALDHPAYELTANLLRINAINIRSGGNFKPYEQILPEEWNYCIDSLEGFLGFGLPADCRFREFDSVDKLTLQDKGRILAIFLGWDEPEFETGASRVEAYNMVEQICFGGRLP